MYHQQFLKENNRPNGLIQVEINNEENKNRSEEQKIVPPTPKSERKEKKDMGDDDEKSLEWHLKDCLEKLAIYDAVWILSKEETFHQVFFPCEGPGMECDFVLQSIQNRGIGEKGLSTVGIMPCDVFYRDYGEEEDDQGDETDAENGEEQEKKGKGFKAMQKEFLKSVTARLTVAQVVEKVKNDGSLSFDFIMFVFIASCIAALGLSENSAIVIVAAMLISPIMDLSVCTQNSTPYPCTWNKNGWFFKQLNSGEEQEKKGKGFKAMQKEFLKSVTARLTVAQVVEKVKNDGSLSFDFIMFVFIASCIAALGLSENSAIVIVAAMLISPIMGPIMAFTFGLTIRDKKLVRMALRTELIGLSICLIAGFLFGFICGNFSETWGAGKWPTTEMAGRSVIHFSAQSGTLCTSQEMHNFTEHRTDSFKFLPPKDALVPIFQKLSS
ncbi:hypothetical protein AVEN_215048-3 [Araneus ventricosus]|uniref:DUF389 domain-containing protein n=1 Tax=Araneus ventricosus TaxID=182803 RepID=A0A4Y2MA04_ARAVE|nr:hypothetical protein AVEN_215048-3 [Araneus ventricosus]